MVFLKYLAVSDENEPVITYEESSAFATSTLFTPNVPPKNYAEIQVNAQDGWTQKTYRINFEKITAISDINWEGQILLYPIPVTNKLNVTFGGPLQGIYYLYDIVGSLKMTSKFKGNFEIDLSEMPRGMYLLNFLTENRLLVTKKIIKE